MEKLSDEFWYFYFNQKAPRIYKQLLEIATNKFRVDFLDFLSL